MAVDSFPSYRLSISRMSLLLRVGLIGCSTIPLFAFVAVQVYLQLAGSDASMVSLLGATVLSIPAHEALHGLVFWIYSRRVSFGFKPWTAVGPVFYAASVGSRFTRRQYQLACIAPQLMTVLLCVVAALGPPNPVFTGLTYAAALNLSGGVFDLFAYAKLFQFPKDAVVEDSREGMDVYLLVQND
jgi:hypothetical protein